MTDRTTDAGASWTPPRPPGIRPAPTPDPFASIMRAVCVTLTMMLARST